MGCVIIVFTLFRHFKSKHSRQLIIWVLYYSIFKLFFVCLVFSKGLYLSQFTFTFSHWFIKLSSICFFIHWILAIGWNLQKKKKNWLEIDFNGQKIDQIKKFEFNILGLKWWKSFFFWIFSDRILLIFLKFFGFFGFSLNF